MSIPFATAGIDAGATLCKLIFQKQTFETARYSSGDLDPVIACIKRWGPERITVTGGGAEALGPAIGGVRVHRVPEFESWARGAPILAARASLELPRSYLLVSLGTGTSILAVREGGPERIGGSALGGGTLLGLGRLLLGVESFGEVTALAANGDRRRVDLLVRDIYRHGAMPLPGDLNAASFGKLASTDPEDLAHAIVGLIGENVAIICASLARATGAEAVVYCGSTVAENPALEEILSAITIAFGSRPLYLPEGAFCGAVGAASLA